MEVPGPAGGLPRRFILADEFSGPDLSCARETLARRHLRGEGIEIGALHKPLRVDPTVARVRYVDYKTKAENRERYRELAGEEIVETDIVDDGFVLGSVPDDSLDFLVANHALEHSPDPLGTIRRWLGKLRRGGALFVAVPIAARCYDEGRPLTTLEHFEEDHRQFTGLRKDDVLRVTAGHLREFLAISGANIRRMNGLPPADPAQDARLVSDLLEGLTAEVLRASDYSGLMNAHIQKINRIYDVHYHTFSPGSYEDFLRHCGRLHGADLEALAKNGGGECVGIVRKR